MSFIAERTFLSKILILMGLIVMGFSLGSLLALLLIQPVFGVDIMNNPEILSVNSSNPITVPILKFVQLIQAVFVFIIPANIYAKGLGGDIYHNLGMHKTSSKNFVLAFVLILICVPVVNALAIFNSKLVLPDFLHSFDAWMRASEKSAEIATRLLMNGTNVSSLIINLVIIALIPAIGEELIFRGILQPLLIQKTKSIHIGIILTAIIFAVLHFQFLSVLPRIFLGALLGYMVVWSGSIWVSVLAHFINNGSAVLADFLYQRKIIDIDLNAAEAFPWLVTIISFLLSFGILYYWNKTRDNKVWSEIG